MASPTANDPVRRAQRRPLERAELIALVVVFVLAAAWGVAWKRSADLEQVASFLPILLLVIGPGVLVVWLGSRVALGRWMEPVVGYVTAAAVVGALLGNLLTAAPAGSVDVSGHLSGTLDGVAVDAPATCTWGPSRTDVIRVAAQLPATSGQAPGFFSKNVPSGTLTLELPTGSIRMTNPPDPSMFASMPLRNGTGGVGEGDRSQGSVALDPAQGAVVAGQLAWTCTPAPAP